MRNDYATRIAAAIVNAGDPAFATHAGATLDELSKLANEGALEMMSFALIAHAQRHPRDRALLIASIPAKVVSQYFPSERRLSEPAISKWRDATPGWAETLKAVAPTPGRFATVARRMAEAASGYS